MGQGQRRLILGSRGHWARGLHPAHVPRGLGRPGLLTALPAPSQAPVLGLPQRTASPGWGMVGKCLMWGDLRWPKENPGPTSPHFPSCVYKRPTRALGHRKAPLKASAQSLAQASDCLGHSCSIYSCPHTFLGSPVLLPDAPALRAPHPGNSSRWPRN